MTQPPARPARSSSRGSRPGSSRPVRRTRPGAEVDAPVDMPLVEVEVGPVAHGGHCVARHEGRVIFVRHALPGERVRVRLTAAAPDAKFWRGDAVEVLESSPDRVPSAWPAAGPGGVGGAELAHVRLDAQRAWKRQVIEEQLRRIAHLDLPVVVEAAPGDDERGGLAYRTRIELVADAEGRAGMRRHRSHDVVALDAMPLATESVAAAAEAFGVFSGRWTAGARLDVVAPQSGAEPILLVDGEPWRGTRVDRRPNARRTVVETVTVGGTEHQFRVAADGFWQVHREAPALLAQAVLDSVGDVLDATVVDLFAGSGLFTAPLAAATGPVGRVVSVEGDERAVASARRNLHGADHVDLWAGDVARVLRDAGHGAVGGADVVVLDPPRAGAGRPVVDQVVSLTPERVVLVSCDPAALARDLGLFGESGYEVRSLRAFDLFPMTHHVECVTVLERV